MYTIVDAKTKQAAFRSGMMLANTFIISGSPVIPVGLYLPQVASLPAGDYHLVVQAADDQKHQSPARIVDFHLE
jgi:hypothetical protein